MILRDLAELMSFQQLIRRLAERATCVRYLLCAGWSAGSTVGPYQGAGDVAVPGMWVYFVMSAGCLPSYDDLDIRYFDPDSSKHDGTDAFSFANNVPPFLCHAFSTRN